ncbi:MAG: hypothetical protein A2X36_01185 [Elusimicrobia bacterium GWA2_69_24]|nr:MAG: hypothetical protein A2X36_01185 [Elusimicrobia bacterium GWA2_69_24]HBL16480.1 hypothetical protein [Elusimicrobiota bacterium]
MRGIGAVVVFVLAAVLMPSRAFARINMVFDVMPGNFINSRDVDGFKTTMYPGTGIFTYSEEASGNLGYIPTMKGGVGIETEDAYLDLTAGFGGFVNSALIGTMALGDAAFYYKAGRKLSFGPHMSYVRVDAKYNGADGWADSDDVHIQGGNGVIYGLNFRLGKTVAFLGSLDYLSVAPLKASTPARTGGRNTTINTSKIDVSGWMVQLGVAFRFFTAR